jgi:glycerophosphoryl diester phosphodiesterase
MSTTPLVISHAACKGHAPENTLAGIRAALNLGADAIEIDVHATADGIPILMHDATVDRTTDGAGRIVDLSLDQIGRLDAGCRAFDGAFAGERVPTLAETLDLTRGRCLLVVEIKAEDIEERVRSVVGAAPGDVMVWSFRPTLVARMRALAPDIPCALLSAPLGERTAAEVFTTALRANAQAVSMHYTSVDAPFVADAARRGLSVFTWTADDPADHHRLAGARVAGIVSNLPDVLGRAIGREEGRGKREV